MAGMHDITMAPDTYDAAGPADAPALVFVHGTRLSRAQWSPQLRGLSDSFRVVAPDLPGHGARAGAPFTFEGAVRVVAAAVEQVAGGRALLIGSSLGGFIALEAAAQRPREAVGVVLAGSSYAFDDRMGRVLSLPYLLASRLATTLGADTMRRLDTKAFRRLYPPAVGGPIVEGGFYHRSIPGVVDGIARWDMPAALRAYGRPILMLNGQHDLMFRRGERKVLATTPNAWLRLVPRAAHLSNLDQPEVFNREVRSFARAIGWGCSPSRTGSDVRRGQGTALRGVEPQVSSGMGGFSSEGEALS